jgi:hypothetical protein
MGTLLYIELINSFYHFATRLTTQNWQSLRKSPAEEKGLSETARNHKRRAKWE